ncbi:MAG: DUF4968 domain-containing protein, partial [Bacteroidales bacterium]|nr:DUF4968 domain-containing protein [Bacteroidales bacterium]
MSRFKPFWTAALALALLGCQRSEVVVRTAGGPAVRLQFVNPEVVRVSVSPDGKFRDRESLMVLPQKDFHDFKVKTVDGWVCVTTSSLQVKIALSDGETAFYRADGTPLALDGHASFEANGEAWSTTVSYASAEDEAFYGLGQHQAGEFDHKGRREELYQYNTKISVPVVVSNKGYGMLFDAYSQGRWGSAQPYRQLGEVFDLELKGTYRTASGTTLVQREDSLFYENEWAIRNLPQVPLSGARVSYDGTITARESGDYHFIQYYAGFQRTLVGGEEVMSRRWRPAWNPNSYKFTVHLEKGVPTPVHIDWEPDGGVSYIGLRVAPLESPVQESRLTYWSEYEPQADYYFMAGENYDAVIRDYRLLTGKAQVMPKWAL